MSINQVNMPWWQSVEESITDDTTPEVEQKRVSDSYQRYLTKSKKSQPKDTPTTFPAALQAKEITIMPSETLRGITSTAVMALSISCRRALITVCEGLGLILRFSKARGRNSCQTASRTKM